MAAMHRNDTIDSARLREAAHAASAAPPHTIHHGRPSRRLRSGSSPYFTAASVTALVTPPIARDPRDDRVHRILDGDGPSRPGILLPKHFPADQDRGHDEDRTAPRRAAGHGEPEKMDRGAIRVARDRVGSTRRHPVQHDRQDHDRDARRRARRRRRALERLIHVQSEAAGTHDGSDHDDAERHHDRLVHAEHDRGLRERELHLPQHAARTSRRTTRRPRPTSAGHAEPEAGQADRGGNAKITVAIMRATSSRC